MALGNAKSLWEAALVLLRQHDALATRTPRDDPWSPEYDRWRIMSTEARMRFRQDHPLLTDDQRNFISVATAHGSDDVACYALGWAVDIEAWPHFSYSWESTLQLVAGRHRLTEGEPFPVTDVDLELLHGATPLPRPAAKRSPRRGELPHIRLYERPQGIDIEAIFDFNFKHGLWAALSELDWLGSEHPNVDLDEFDIPATNSVFPVVVRDPARQFSKIVKALPELVSKRAVFVLPELSVTPEIVDRLRSYLDENHPYEDWLVVAGSYHTQTTGVQKNVSCALVPGWPDVMQHSKLVRFTNELSRSAPSAEGIEEGHQLVVYCADPFRFSILICKDLLDPDIARHVAFVGVNVLGVPSMSEKTHDFEARVHAFVTDTQGFAVVANGPLEWRGVVVDPCAVFGRPLENERVTSRSPGVSRPARPVAHLVSSSGSSGNSVDLG